MTDGRLGCLRGVPTANYRSFSRFISRLYAGTGRQILLRGGGAESRGHDDAAIERLPAFQPPLPMPEEVVAAAIAIGASFFTNNTMVRTPVLPPSPCLTSRHSPAVAAADMMITSRAFKHGDDDRCLTRPSVRLFAVLRLVIIMRHGLYFRRRRLPARLCYRLTPHRSCAESYQCPSRAHSHRRRAGVDDAFAGMPLSRRARDDRG